VTLYGSDANQERGAGDLRILAISMSARVVAAASIAVPVSGKKLDAAAAQGI